VPSFWSRRAATVRAGPWKYSWLQVWVSSRAHAPHAAGLHLTEALRFDLARQLPRHLRRSELVVVEGLGKEASRVDTLADGGHEGRSRNVLDLGVVRQV
jgi:hypothetical protein